MADKGWYIQNERMNLNGVAVGLSEQYGWMFYGEGAKEPYVLTEQQVKELAKKYPECFCVWEEK